MKDLVSKIRGSALVQSFAQLEHTPKMTLLIQPLWAIPFRLYIPFVTVYMAALGVTDLQLGFLVTLGMLVQAASAFVGGALVDKYGRRKVIFISDTICWCTSSLLYALGCNYWWFFAATIFFNLNQIPSICYTCLLVEDSKPEHLVTVFSWSEVVNLLAVFFAPVTIYLVAKYSLVPTLRTLFFISIFVMFSKFLLLFLFSHETSRGKERMQETKDTPFHQLLTGYWDVFKMILNMPEMLLLILLMMISSISSIAANTFGMLYITRDLGIADKFIPVFPIFSAVIKLFMMTGLQARMSKIQFRISYITGYLLVIAGHIVLLLSPAKNLPIVILYVIIDSVAYAFISPRMSALQAMFIHKEQRARMTGLLSILLVLVASPFGFFVGQLSSINTRLPFFFSIGMYSITVFIALFSKKFSQHTKVSEENGTSAKA